MSIFTTVATAVDIEGAGMTHAVERDECRDPARKSYLHRKDPYHRRPGTRDIPQLRWSSGGPTFTSRRLRRRHQPRAAVCRRMVGLFHQRDENSSRQNETGPPG